MMILAVLAACSAVRPDDFWSFASPAVDPKIAAAFVLDPLGVDQDASAVVDDPENRVDARAGFELRAFYEHVELSAVTTRVTNDSALVSRTKLSHASRTRSGIEGTFGPCAARLYYEESFDTYFGAGFGITVGGSLPFATGVVQPALEYGIGVDLVGTEVLFGFLDALGGGASSPVGTYYADLSAHIGPSLGFGPIQASTGVQYDGLIGNFDADGNSGEISGSNVGGYCSLSFRHRDVPFFARVSFDFGEITGFGVTVGYAF